MGIPPDSPVVILLPKLLSESNILPPRELEELLVKPPRPLIKLLAPLKALDTPRPPAVDNNDPPIPVSPDVTIPAPVKVLPVPAKILGALRAANPVGAKAGMPKYIAAIVPIGPKA